MATTGSGDRSILLVRSLQTIPIDWALTPVNGNKIPYTTGWQKTPVPRNSIASDIDSGHAQGFGILTGKLSGGIMAIDCDGHIPHQLFKELLESDIPHTVSFTSGKDGRAQYLFTIPEEQWDVIKTKKIGKAKEEGQLEFRWDGCQSVLPPSVHPETGQYQWINSPDTTEIAPLPAKVLDYLLKKPNQKTSAPPNRTKSKPTRNSNEVLPPIPIEWCLSKIHREALENGEHDGNRDDMGCSLARDLIGVAAHVPSISFEYRKKTYQLNVEGDPYQLLYEYCQKCTPPLRDRDCDRIYKSAQNYNPSPSIQDEDSLLNCLRSWVKENTEHQDHTPSKIEGKGEKDSGRPHFTTSWEGGLKWETMKSTSEGEPQWVSKLVGNHIEAIAYCENPEGSGTGILLEFRTQRGKAHRVLIPRTTLTGDGSEALRFLADRGYYFHRKQKQLLLDYLFGLGGEVARVYTIADRTGWVNNSFLTPAKTYGDENLRFRDPEPDRTITEISGTLDEWKQAVAMKCDGNSRLIFAVGTAFAPALLEPAQVESGGFHLVGTTSIGKTTALRVAASVAGLKNIPNWRSTANALEGKAAEFNHGLLPLDEIGQADPATIGQAAYMLANGQGKGRMNKHLANIKPKTWNLIFLSTGEVSMTDYLRQAKIPIKGGMETRMPSIPAYAGKGYGVFENLHGYRTAAEFVTAIESAILKYQGTALDGYLSQLVEARKSEGFDRQLRERVHTIARELSQQLTDSAIGRVAVRFALVQVGLEIAHSFGLLPFKIEQCAWVVSQMFQAWINERGGEGSIKIKEACKKIEHLFVSNQHGERIKDSRFPDRTVRNLLAYRIGDTVTNDVEYCVPTAIFAKEMSSGVDRSELIKELQSRGHLKPSIEGDRHTVKRTIEGKRIAVFAFREFWIEAEEQQIDLGDRKNERDARDTRDSEAETSTVEEFQVSRDLSRDKNLNGTHGTAIEQNSNECPVCPVNENLTGQQQDTSESLPLNGFKAPVPCVPSVPLEKHSSQTAPVKIPLKVGDRVCYVGDNRVLLERVGTIEDVNHASQKYQVNWDGDYSGRTWFFETELEATA